MEKLLGPVLYARQDDADHWRFDVAALLSGDSAQPPPCELEVMPPTGNLWITGPEPAADFSAIGRGVYWRWHVRLPRTDRETQVGYRLRATRGDLLLDGAEHSVVIPRRGQLPRLLFYSCNGFSDAKYIDRVPDLFALWKRALALHEQAAERPELNLRGGYHAMIGGGDQIYADSLWFTVKELDQMRQTRQAARPRWPLPAGFAETLLTAYVDLYILRWGRPEVSEALARIPGIFTWDDHDIFDGWGSYAPELQSCDAYRAIFAAARTTFEAFQLGGADSPSRIGTPSHCLQALTFEGDGAQVDLLLLDLRTDRSLQQVMSPQQWDDLNHWLAERSLQRRTRRHLLVISSIPLVYMRFAAWQERVGSLAELDDDMRDQWESTCHRGERARLVMTLLAHASLSRSQVTVLSGDVHVGSRGRILSHSPSHTDVLGGHGFIEQLTSSAIVHPPPTAWESLLMRAAAFESPDEINAHVTAKLLPVGRDRYLCERNWLSIDFTHTDGATRPITKLWAQWWTEDAAIEPQVVVDAYDPAPARAVSATTTAAPAAVRGPTPLRRPRLGGPRTTTKPRRR